MDLELSDQSNEEEHKSEHHHSAGSAGSAEEPNPPFATEQQLTCFLQKADAERWVKQRNFAGYYETSPKDGNGYSALFADIAEKLQ